MKNLLYILPLLLLPLLGLAQKQNINESVKKENTNYKNQIDFGFEILAPSFSYTRKVTNKISVGFGFGVGYSLGFASSIYTPKNKSKFYLKDGVLEEIHLGLIIKFRLRDNVYYEFKPQLSGITTDVEFGGEIVYGVKNGFFIRVKKIKIGLI